MFQRCHTIFQKCTSSFNLRVTVTWFCQSSTTHINAFNCSVIIGCTFLNYSEAFYDEPSSQCLYSYIRSFICMDTFKAVYRLRIKDYFTLTKVVFPPVGTLTLSPRKLPFMCSHILTQSFLFLFLIIWCAHYCCHLHDKQMLGPEVTLNPRSSIIPHIIHIHLFPSLCLSHTLSLAAAYLPSGGRTDHMHEWRCIWSTYLKPRW